MGIFGKKTKEIEARAMYYEGETPDFILDHAYKIRLGEEFLFIVQVVPMVEARIGVSRIGL